MEKRSASSVESEQRESMKMTESPTLGRRRVKPVRMPIILFDDRDVLAL